MKRLALYLAIALGATLWAGCLGYHHSRNFTATEKKESTTAFALFTKGAADAISSTTTDNATNYTRKVGVEKATTSGDAETVTATGGAVGEAGKVFISP